MWRKGVSTFCPAQQRRDELKGLEFLGIGAIDGEEVEEVIRDDLAVDIVFRAAFFQYAKRFGKVLIERYGFVAQFANEQVLLFDFSFKGDGAF